MDLSEYRDYGDAYRPVGRFLDAVSNQQRIHSALGSLTPAEFEQPWRSAQTSGLVSDVRSPAVPPPGLHRG